MDIKGYLAGQLLAKADRAGMAHSLEVRYPFLSSDLVEFVLRLDCSIIRNEYRQKWLLYENIRHVMPCEILERKKQGFIGPHRYYGDILWYRKMLKRSELVANGIARMEYIENLLNGGDFWRLWKVLILELWYRRWR